MRDGSTAERVGRGIWRGALVSRSLVKFSTSPFVSEMADRGAGAKKGIWPGLGGAHAE